MKSYTKLKRKKESRLLIWGYCKFTKPRDKHGDIIYLKAREISNC